MIKIEGFWSTETNEDKAMYFVNGKFIGLLDEWDAAKAFERLADACPNEVGFDDIGLSADEWEKKREELSAAQANGTQPIMRS